MPIEQTHTRASNAEKIRLAQELDRAGREAIADAEFLAKMERHTRKCELRDAAVQIAAGMAHAWNWKDPSEFNDESRHKAHKRNDDIAALVATLSAKLAKAVLAECEKEAMK